MLTNNQQALELIKNSKEILIALPSTLNGDLISSAIALNLTLKKLDKKVSIVSSDVVREKFNFLESADNISLKLSSGRIFEIMVSKENKRITQARYENTPETIKFFLTSEGDIKATDIIVKHGRFIFDLIITLGAIDLKSLGKLYEENNKLFLDSTILNIDNQSANDQYGQINIIDLTTSSIAESVYPLIELLDSSVIDAKIATALLTGIIIKTNHFKSHLTSQTFLTSSALLRHGANQQEITTHLYRAKPLSAIRLIGKILSDSIEYDEEKKFIIAWLTRETVEALEASADDIESIPSELAKYFPDTIIKMFIYEKSDGLNIGIVDSPKSFLVDKIRNKYSGSLQNSALRFEITHEDITATKNFLKNLLFANL